MSNMRCFAAVVAAAAMSGLAISSANAFTINFDENGNATCDLSGCGNASVGPDPTHLVSGNVLTYTLPPQDAFGNPLLINAGTVGINNASGQLSDALRFTNANGDLFGNRATQMIFYSFDDFGSLADVSMPPGFVAFAGATENAAGSFTFDTGTNVFNGMSDVEGTTPSEIPAPEALPLFATGLGALGLLGRRRKRRAELAAAA